uniref:EF-hand domain-containing protein n=1 Tax=Angiostrongylus cantonensis TaxID=6313 RepID=A0A0K0DMS6_ANGCA
MYQQLFGIVYADSSGNQASGSGQFSDDSSASSRKQVRREIVVDDVIDPQEFSVNVKHVKPLLPAGKHTHTPLIQVCDSFTPFPKETAIATHAALSGLSPEKERGLRDLYDRLDIDNDGTVDIRDLTAALKREMPHIPARLAPKLMARLSSGSEEKVDFRDFVKYVLEHEKRLEVIFQDLDKNNDGKSLPQLKGTYILKIIVFYNVRYRAVI